MQKLVLQIIYSFVIRYFLKVIVGVKFDDAKFLINEKQFIIVANHNSHLDTMSLMASLPSSLISKVKPIAAKDHFGKTKIAEKLTNFFVNALLIERKGNKEGDNPITKMLKTLDDGYSLILFPEGTRGKPEEVEPLKKGIALLLSQRPNIKYVPAYMIGMGKAMPKDDNLIIPFNSSLTFGKPTLIKDSNVSNVLLEVENALLQLRDKQL